MDQDTYLKALNSDAFDQFGFTVSLSNDGRALVVGAPFEDSDETGAGEIDLGSPNNSAVNSGAVYTYRDVGLRDWDFTGYTKAGNTGMGDQFGSIVSLSGDGLTLAVGAPAEDSNATGFDMGAQDNSASSSGAVYVFTRPNTLAAWSQQAYVKASNTDAGDQFGSSLDLSEDGNTLAVGAWSEDSSARLVDSTDQDNNLASNAGAVYVFARSNVGGGGWVQDAYIKASNTGVDDAFGFAVSLSDNGNTLAVGAPGEASDGTGIDVGEFNNDSAPRSGAVYQFARLSVGLGGGEWSKQAYLRPAIQTQTIASVLR